MSHTVPRLPLNDKRAIPAAAFGTATGHSGLDDTDYILRAIEGGFDHIDTAQWYKNEESVGEALRKAFENGASESKRADLESQKITALTREDIWVTTKYGGGGDAEAALDTSLKKLGLSSVDLYIIHSPSVAPDLHKTWSELERAHACGKAKSIGVSNFDTGLLKLVLEHGKLPPAVNQIQFHPYNYQDNIELLKFCNEQGIRVESYGGLWPISHFPGGKLDDVIMSISKRLGPKVTPAQVLMSWIYAKGVVIVTSTSRKERIQECLNVFSLPPLTKEDVFAIDEAGRYPPPGQLVAQREHCPSNKARLFSAALMATLGLAALYKFMFM